MLATVVVYTSLFNRYKLPRQVRKRRVFMAGGGTSPEWRAERAKTSQGRSHALDDTLEQQHGPKRMKRDITAQKRHELKKPIRVLLAVLIAMAGASVVLAVYIANIDSSNAAERDFISYWAAGQQLVHGQNPYDIEAVRALETGAGRNPSEHVLMMRNPPVAFFMALPFGYMRPKTGLITWLIVLIGVLLLASFLIWRLNQRPDSLFNFFGFGFAPALSCLMAGQCGILLLLGVVLFLFLYRRQPFWAGASLLLCALKPHYFLLFGIALFLWCLMAKSRLRILVGFCVAMAASCAFDYSRDARSWQQYSQMMRTGGALNEVVPVLSAELRLLIDSNAVWIQFVPEVAACVWTVWYFWRKRAEWDWMDHGFVLLLVGAICTPFGFLPDQSLLLPALLAGVFCAVRRQRGVWPLVVIAGAALLEVGLGATIVSPAYLWTPVAWLLWYLYATGRFSRQVQVTAF